jgi:hypothetical protein
LHGVFQTLGAALGTALIGSVLIAALSNNFNSNIQASSLPSNIKTTVAANSQAGVTIVPLSTVDDYAQTKGVSQANANKITQIYSDSQIEALRVSLYALIMVAAISLLFSKNIPDKKPA